MGPVHSRLTWKWVEGAESGRWGLGMHGAVTPAGLVLGGAAVLGGTHARHGRPVQSSQREGYFVTFGPSNFTATKGGQWGPLSSLFFSPF